MNRLAPPKPAAVVSCALLALAAVGCKQSTPRSAAEARARLIDAANKGDVVAIHQLLDRKTQWAIISVFKSKREIRQLVKSHYPPARRARELRRTQVAAQAGNATAYFVLLAKKEGLVAPLQSAPERAFCNTDGGFWYCGMRERFDQLKVRAARDLALVKENAETFKKER